MYNNLSLENYVKNRVHFQYSLSGGFQVWNGVYDLSMWRYPWLCSMQIRVQYRRQCIYVYIENVLTRIYFIMIVKNYKYMWLKVGKEETISH